MARRSHIPAQRTDTWGIDSGYEDCEHRWCWTAEETRRALLKSMHVQPGSRPPAARVKVIRPGENMDLRGPAELRLEDGTRVAVDGEFTQSLPFGYHDFHPRRGKPVRLIVTPGSCYLPEDLRWWGWAVQLYAVRSRHSWGIGDLEDLRNIAAWAADLGAGVIMVNPLGAASPGVRQQTSPYYPSSRLFRNPLYLRIDETAEPAHLGEAARSLNGQRLIDRDRVFQLKMQALARLWDGFAGKAEFDRYCEQQGELLHRFAIFCVLSEQLRSGWRCWPSGYRDPASEQVRTFAEEHKGRVRFFEWLQWLLDTQLERCSERLALMQDFPVGVDPSGADAWMWQEVLADGVSFGAPPDPFAADGQNWGLPPFIPHRLRAVGYEPFIQTIRAAMRHAGALRIDHAMGLFRLFWIPKGAPASEGAYVRYPVDDLLGIIALESQRARAIVVGEDLGTVEDGVREKLAAHNILCSKVLWFEQDQPANYPRRSMASVTTHDLPTIAGLWTGSDLRAQREACLNANEKSMQEIRERLKSVAAVTEAATKEEVVERAHVLLGQAPSMVITASLDDALACEERPNMPSTTDQWPNWSLALPASLEDIQKPSAVRSHRSRPAGFRVMGTRRLPVGAEAMTSGGVHFRVWAPARRKVEVLYEGGVSELAAEPDSYFSGHLPRAAAGLLYRYRLDGGEAFPDPASRFQPQGVHGPSQVVDPGVFKWTDDAWMGRRLQGQVIYEMHAGTFTREGTWDAARKQLPELAAAGITVVEVMPVAEFPGKFGWGYDSVAIFAPTRLYGSPDDFRRFVNDAHHSGVAVILDVVYNHVGPDGNYLSQFSRDYFTDRYKNEWGQAINFDGENSGPVREFFASNAGYWIQEFHLDGLRLDATQQIFDASDEHILKAISNRVRVAAAGRDTIIVAENEPQDSSLAHSTQDGGYGLDGLWNDDFHHAAIVAMTGHNEAYYTDYLGNPQEFISAAKYGFLYQGQRYKWQGKRRGSPTYGLNPSQFVTFIQNHDQIANSGKGERIDRLTSPGKLRAMTALLLLQPGTPMLFQGQEFAASSPFLFFADHNPQLNELVRKGRGEFMTQFRSLLRSGMYRCLADPGSPATFNACKLDFTERKSHAEIYALHRDLIRLKHDDPAFRSTLPRTVDGAVLGANAFVLRFFGIDGQDRLLLVNLGVDLHLNPAPEPLLAPPAGRRWTVLWSSEDHKYGGLGTFPPDTEDNWRIQGNAAVVLSPAPPTEVDETGEVKP